MREKRCPRAVGPATTTFVPCVLALLTRTVTNVVARCVFDLGPLTFKLEVQDPGKFV